VETFSWRRDVETFSLASSRPPHPLASQGRASTWKPFPNSERFPRRDFRVTGKKKQPPPGRPTSPRGVPLSEDATWKRFQNAETFPRRGPGAKRFHGAPFSQEKRKRFTVASEVPPWKRFVKTFPRGGFCQKGFHVKGFHVASFQKGFHVNGETF
jgi:hypothetical protein